MIASFICENAESTSRGSMCGDHGDPPRWSKDEKYDQKTGHTTITWHLLCSCGSNMKLVEKKA